MVARVALIVVVLLAARVEAQDRVGVGLFIHADDDDLLVVHPTATARVGLSEDTTVAARYEADVVTAATVDVRTSASVRGFEEVRNGFGLGIDQALARTVRLGGSYGASISPDYVTHAGAARLLLEDDARTHLVGVGLGVAHDTVSRVGNTSADGTVLSLGSDLTWSVVLGERAVLDVALTLEWRDGFLESPYRFVPITDPGGASTVHVPEEVPDTQVRGAGRVGLRISPAEDLFANASYRLHADDWGVLGHTVRAEIALAIAEIWLPSLSCGVYVQRAASFYEGTYATLPDVPTLRTLDRELASTHYVTGGAGLDVDVAHIGDAVVQVSVRVDVKWQRYLDTPRLPERTSLGTGLVVALRR